MKSNQERKRDPHGILPPCSFHENSRIGRRRPVGPARRRGGLQGVRPESSGLAEGIPSRNQQSVLRRTRATLDTKISRMLPAGVPVAKGYLTSATSSQPTHYQVKFYETSQPAEINSPAALKGTLVATVEGTRYKDAAGAKGHVSSYEQVNLSDYASYGKLVNLGHGVKAGADVGTGHQCLTWNEGRWCLRVDSPTDPANQNKEYPDAKQLAENVVAYLEDHMLPAPQKIGVISMDIWGWNYGATVEWQENQTVYRIASEDPMTALKVAAAMEPK